MNIFLESLKKSITHLEIIDKVFSSYDYPEKEVFNKLKEEIQEHDSINPTNKFTEELYVGGKKRNTSLNQGYGRQMILSDLLQYIVNGRGYFYAIRNTTTMKNYIRILLKIVNLLMIFDSIVVETNVRREILTNLESELGNDFFKDDDRRREHEALLLHDAPIGLPLANPDVSEDVLIKLGTTNKDKALKLLSTYYDSLLPKTAGGLWGELLVYLYLLRKNIGFVFPLVLNQRLLSGNHKIYLKPPDFLLLPFGKNTFYGIEVGAGKEIQSGTFSIITGVPTATKANMDNPKRCCICGKWMLFCPKVIEEYSDVDYEIENIKRPIKCTSGCNKFTREQILNKECSYAMHKGGQPQNHVMKMRVGTYHFHFNCYKDDPHGDQNISENNIVSYYPYVGGLEDLEDLTVDQAVVKQKIEELNTLLTSLNQTSSEED